MKKYTHSPHNQAYALSTSSHSTAECSSPPTFGNKHRHNLHNFPNSVVIRRSLARARKVSADIFCFTLVVRHQTPATCRCRPTIRNRLCPINYRPIPRSAFIVQRTANATPHRRRRRRDSQPRQTSTHTRAISGAAPHFSCAV